jgi:hypothetical protein
MTVVGSQAHLHRPSGAADIAPPDRIALSPLDEAQREAEALLEEIRACPHPTCPYRACIEAADPVLFLRADGRPDLPQFIDLLVRGVEPSKAWCDGCDSFMRLCRVLDSYCAAVLPRMPAPL